MSTAKVSVAIGQEELAWARSIARRDRKSLSAVLTESLAEQKRQAVLREVLAWMEDGQAPLSAEELERASRELGTAPSSLKPHAPGKRASRRRA